MSHRKSGRTGLPKFVEADAASNLYSTYYVLSSLPDGIAELFDILCGPIGKKGVSALSVSSCSLSPNSSFILVSHICRLTSIFVNGKSWKVSQYSRQFDRHSRSPVGPTPTRVSMAFIPCVIFSALVAALVASPTQYMPRDNCR